MSVIRLGSTGKFSDGWDSAFGGKKSKAASKKTAKKKVAKKAPKKKSRKK